MAVDKKISQLTSLAQVDVVTTTDVLPIVDTSVTETKKITVGALVGAGAAAGLTGVDINSGSIDGTTIGASSASTGAFTTLSASGAVTLNPANAAVSLAPTGTGTVTINPATAGTLNNVAIGGSSAAAGTFTSATVSTGNLTFSGTAQRITGDMSNATQASRLLFQTSTTNGATSVACLPNGTGTQGNFLAWNNSDLTNAAWFGILATSTEARLQTNISGTGTALPLTFSVNGSERMRLDTSGNVGIGVTPSTKLDIAGGTGGSRVQFAISSAEMAFYAVNNANSAYADATWRAASHAYFTGATERMRIDSSGNVGIGTASPATKLQVYGDVNSSVSVRVTNNNAGASASSLFSFGNNADGNVGYVGCVSSGAAVANGVYLGNRISGPLLLNTNDTERMRIDSSGNVGIGGTAGGNVKVQLQGSYPVLGGNANTNGVAVSMEVPSAITGSAFVFRSLPSIAASTATTNVYQFGATNVTLGAGASLTNAYGFFADAMTSATNNYGFYSNIASGSNRWNFYAAGTARNYFAGRTDVGNTRIAATNDWSGVSIGSETAIGVADGATITLTSVTCGAVMVHVYDINSGNGGVFFGTYSTTVTKVAGDGEATDTGSTFAVYKSAGSHTMTFKNKYGGATRNFRIAVFSASPAPG